MTDILLRRPVMDAIDAQLTEHFTVHRMAGLDDSGFAEVAPKIRAVVTPGDVGCPTELIAALPALEMIGVNGVGYDGVDVEAARARNIRVSNTPDVLTDDVADSAVALALMTTRKFGAAERFARSGAWLNGGFPLTRKFSTVKIGIFGLGRIGLAIAERLAPFGVEISYCSRSPKADVPYAYHPDVLTLARHVDMIIISASSNATTAKIINDDVINALGPTGMIVNIARGAIIDEVAMITALQDGRLGGAGLDVFAAEPTIPDALLTMEQVVITPHIGSGTVETRQAMGQLVVENLKAWAAGKPILTSIPELA